MKEGNLRSFPTDPSGGGSPGKPGGRWRFPAISGIHALILGTGILAFVANLALLRGGDAPGPQVAVSQIDLAPGRRLELDDIRFTPVDVEEPIAAGLLSEAELPAYQGWVLTGRVPKDFLLNKTDLRDPAAESTLRAMSLPINADHAVGGDIVPGDVVDIIRVNEDQARFVATGLQVLDVPDSSQGGLVPSGSFRLVLAVNERTALILALALANGQVDVVRATGSAPVTVTSVRDLQPESSVSGPSTQDPSDPFRIRPWDPQTHPEGREEPLR